MTLARAEFIAALLSETQFYVCQINQHLFVYLGGGGGHPSLSLSSPPLSVSVLPRRCPARVSLPRLAPIKHPLQGARGCPAHFKVIKQRNQQTCTRAPTPPKKKEKKTTLQVPILESILVALWRIQMETKWCLTQLQEEPRKLPGILFCVSETSECLEERGRQRLVGGWGYFGLGKRMEQSLLWRKSKQFGLDGGGCCCKQRETNSFNKLRPVVSRRDASRVISHNNRERGHKLMCSVLFVSKAEKNARETIRRADGDQFYVTLSSAH